MTFLKVVFLCFALRFSFLRRPRTHHVTRRWGWHERHRSSLSAAQCHTLASRDIVCEFLGLLARHLCFSNYDRTLKYHQNPSNLLTEEARFTSGSVLDSFEELWEILAVLSKIEKKYRLATYNFTLKNEVTKTIITEMKSSRGGFFSKMLALAESVVFRFDTTYIIIVSQGSRGSTGIKWTPEMVERKWWNKNHFFPVWVQSTIAPLIPLMSPLSIRWHRHVRLYKLSC